MIVLDAVRWLANVLWVSCHLVLINNTGRTCLHHQGEQSHSGTLYTTRAFYNNVVNKKFFILVNVKVKAIHTIFTIKALLFCKFLLFSNQDDNQIMPYNIWVIIGLGFFRSMVKISIYGTIKHGFMWFVLSDKPFLAS